MRNRGRGRIFSKFLTILAFSSVAIAAFTISSAQANVCEDLFRERPTQSAAVQAFVVADPYEQWLLWEELANRHNLIKPTEPIAFQMVRVPRAEVEVWTSPKYAAFAGQMFQEGAWVLWPKHAYNQDSTVPFFDRKEAAPALGVRMTASRSAAPVANRRITVKTPTDHPHDPVREHEPKKVKTDEDIRDAILRSRHFAEVDARFGADAILVQMPDVFAIIDKKTRGGVLVRDISRLSNGDYHLPGLSIPYVGREIAALNGQSFAEFWGEAYARNLGRAKARMLLRYGVQMDTPNAQNFLIPMDANLKPTGQIVARDVPDSYFVEPIARALGFGDAVERDIAAGLPIESKINPNWENSRFLFDDAGDHSIDRETLEGWRHAHDMGYIEEIERALGVTILKNKKQRSAFLDFFVPATPISKLQDFLVSPEGLKRLSEFAKGNRLP